MSDDHVFAPAARLSRRGCLAVPRQNGTVDTWLAGRGRGALRVTAQPDGTGEAWAWQRDGRTCTHSCADPDGAADAIAEFLRRMPP
jgi:hypothetical protein